MAFDVTDAKGKRALLLHSAGVDVKKIHKTLIIHTTDKNEDEYTKTRDALNNYFMPKKNVEYEIFNFRQEKQKSEESLDMCYTHLKILLHTVNLI